MTAVNVTSRLPRRPVMRTFWLTAKSDAPPCTSKQLLISAPYHSDMRCGTKKTKISFGGTANSRTNSRLAIEELVVLFSGILVNFHQDERHIVCRGAVAPLGNAVKDSLFHLLKWKQGSLAHDFLHALHSEHIAARIEHVCDPVGIEHDTVSRFEVYVKSRFRSYRVWKRT